MIEVKIIQGGLNRSPKVPKGSFGVCQKCYYSKDLSREKRLINRIKKHIISVNPFYKIEFSKTFINHKKHSRYSFVGIVYQADFYYRGPQPAELIKDFYKL